MKTKRFWRIAVGVGIAVWTLWIWSQSLQSAEDSSADSGRIVRWIAHLMGWDTHPEWLTYAVRKTAHFAEFWLLGVLWGVESRLWTRRGLWWWGVPIGAVDECLQFFAPGRAPMVLDVGIDTAGYLCGVAVVWMVWRLTVKKKDGTV